MNDGIMPSLQTTVTQQTRLIRQVVQVLISRILRPIHHCVSEEAEIKSNLQNSQCHDGRTGQVNGRVRQIELILPTFNVYSLPFNNSSRFFRLTEFHTYHTVSKQVGPKLADELATARLTHLPYLTDQSCNATSANSHAAAATV